MATPKTFTTIEIETRNRIGTLWLNRPEIRNAFNDTMIGELTRAYGVLARDPAVHAIVIAGRGSAFCAGADLNWMKRTSTYSRRENERDAMALAKMLATLNTLPKPTLARVHGPTYAGGLGLVCACDIAVASSVAEFSVSEVKLGLTPSTISPYVLGAIGARQARRYFLTAERFGAEEAQRVGLVHAVAPEAELDARVEQLLDHLLQGGAAAQANAKTLIRGIAGKPISPALMVLTAKNIAATRASPEGKEGIRAFLERRRPAWHPAGREGGERST